MKPVHLLAIFAEDKPGQVARITGTLAAAGINVRWVAFATSDKFGVIKLLVDQTDAASRALQREGWTVSQLDVLAVEVSDRPGGLHAVAECLTRHGVNIANVSGFVSHTRAVLLFEVPDAASARRLLAAEKFHLLSAEEMLRM